jgi:hypothetical protein
LASCITGLIKVSGHGERPALCRPFGTNSSRLFFLRMASVHHAKKSPPPATQTAHNLDLSTVTIPFTAHATPAPGNHCRVFLRGHALYALTNPARKPRRARYSLCQPLSHGLSSLSSLNSHISAKTVPRRPRPHLSTTTIFSDRASTRRRIFRPSAPRILSRGRILSRFKSGLSGDSGNWEIGQIGFDGSQPHR